VCLAVERPTTEQSSDACSGWRTTRLGFDPGAPLGQTAPAHQWRPSSPDVVHYGPNTRQHRGAGPTKDQHETTPRTPPLNLQNLHPRFKSERRLHCPEQNPIVCVLATQTRALQLDYGGLQVRGRQGTRCRKPLVRRGLRSSMSRRAEVPGTSYSALSPCSLPSKHPGSPPT
jgi:hypothetical protein